MERVFDFHANAPASRGERKNYLETVMHREAPGELISSDNPFLLLSDRRAQMRHHQRGFFRHPMQGAAFEYRDEEQEQTAGIISADRRLLKVLAWLGEKKLLVRLSGRHTEEGFAVYRIHAVDPTGRTDRPSTGDGMLQLAIRRLLASHIQDEEEPDDLSEGEIVLTDLPTMTEFLQCAGDSLPPEIRSWAYRNIKLLRSGAISAEERRHAQRALSMMLNIQWRGSYFESVDVARARQILDEAVYGLEQVKQRIVENIIQINRTHTLPAYGLLRVGPAGTGKSQMAYAVAKILKLPWTSLDMSAIHESEALTGSPRIYSNAKPGRIMEAFAEAGSSNLVFIINELDKADDGSALGNPADALLTLLDNLGFTDNYVECMIPTGGVYPIATANDKRRISEPLMTRFAVIEIPDYTPEEKKIIFQRFSLPRVLERMGMTAGECVVTEEGAEAVVKMSEGQPGCRELEQAAEHLAAHALFLIETEGMTEVVYDAEDVQSLLRA